MKTKHLCLKYRKWEQHEWEVVAYMDFAFADDPKKFKSTGGFLLFFNGNLVHWRSKKLAWVATSSSEAEFFAAYDCARELKSVGHILEDLFCKSLWPVVMLSDNKAVVNIVNGTAPTKLTRHQGSKFFALQQWVQQGILRVDYVPGPENWADGMTKISPAFAAFQRNVLERRGGVETKRGKEETRNERNIFEANDTRGQKLFGESAR
eukprot:snap_masked-scaffold_42-processed-gene-2.44-mRNA-1 protein AED:1.00 eAED:1.00 QI:0/-1/0/0/-1/1/1/0/206